MPTRAEIVASLREIAGLLTLQGANPYKARAFERGARALEASKVPVSKLVDEDRLRDLPGIGHALAAHIEELHTKGHSELLETLRKGLPRGVLELSQVGGIGLHSVKALHEELGIDSIRDLHDAARAGRLRTVKGFSEAREKKVLAALERHETEATTVRLHHGLALARAIEDELRESDAVRAVHLAGELRRFHELATSVDLVVVASTRQRAVDVACAMPRVASVEHRDAHGCRLRLADGTRVVVAVCREPDLGPVLVRATGSAAHVDALVERARGRGDVLGVDGLRQAGRKIRLPDERALYERLGLAFVPPELREGDGEIERAETGSFDDLVEKADVTGFVHCHSTWSDGKNTIEEMARAAEALGASFMTVTDHSRAAHYAGGLDEGDLHRQWDEIASVQERVDVTLLRGTEADILADGALDWPDRVLEELDVVIASIHQRYKQDESKMTERVLRAMRHPVFKIWGHPLGRLVASRPPIPLRMEEVLDALAESRAAIEISGDPHRLDLEPRWARAARERRIPFVLSVDAHATDDLGFLDFAVGLARRAGVRRREVLNTLPAARFAARVHP